MTEAIYQWCPHVDYDGSIQYVYFVHTMPPALVACGVFDQSMRSLGNDSAHHVIVNGAAEQMKKANGAVELINKVNGAAELIKNVNGAGEFMKKVNGAVEQMKKVNSAAELMKKDGIIIL